MAPRTPQPLLAALAEHPRQGTPHRGELTRSIEAADNRARDRLSDDPDAVYGVWKCLRTVCHGYFKNKAIVKSTRERRLTEPSRRPAPQELDRKRSSSTLSLDLIHQLVQLLPRQYKRCAIRPRRVRHARLRLPPERTLTSAPVASRRPALLPPRQV